jgi:hypothetical protein
VVFGRSLVQRVHVELYRGISCYTSGDLLLIGLIVSGILSR